MSIVVKAWRAAYVIGPEGYYMAEQLILQRKVGRVAGRMMLAALSSKESA
jgi:hypothetical protein